jgi:hypothetical protein
MYKLRFQYWLHVNAEKSTTSIYVIYTQFVMAAATAIWVITKNYNLNQQFINHYMMTVMQNMFYNIPFPPVLKMYTELPTATISEV